MGTYYNIDGNYKYSNPDSSKIESVFEWASDEIDGVDNNPYTQLFQMWGDASYSFDDDLLKMLNEAGELIEAEVFVHDTDEGSYRKNVWDAQNHEWIRTTGVICYSLADAIKAFGPAG